MTWKFKGKCRDPHMRALLAPYEIGLLSAEDRAAFEMHAFTCDFCFRELYEFQACAAAMRAAPDRVYPRFEGEAAGRVNSGPAWTRTLLLRSAYAFALLCLFALPWAVYKIIGLQKEIHRLQGGHEKQRAELSQQIAGLDQEKKRHLAEIAELKSPRSGRAYANTLSYALELSALRSLSEMEAIDVPQGVQIINLILKVAARQPYDSYRVEVREDSGELLVESYGLRKDKYQMLQLAIPAALLSTRAYTLKIYGVAGGKTAFIAERRFHVRM